MTDGTKMPKFSVIVPAYNSELYIGKGLQSVRDQSFKDYELIVVCDSCVDHTKDVAELYGADIYEVNFHQDGQTRNVGLDHARGEWILFLDDDDWFLHEFAFEMIDKMLKKVDTDILMFSAIWKGVGFALNTEKFYQISVWNKCWRREFIGDTRFSDVKYKSDLDFHNAMFAKNPRVSIWEQPFYYHNHMREGCQTYEQKQLGLITDW